MDKSEAVRVAIRTRPLIGIELAKQCKKIIQYPLDKQILIGQSIHSQGGASSTILKKRFTYDYVFKESSTQEEVYTSCILPLVNNYLSGYNATILAYGQTGSGKTYTMGTSTIGQNNSGSGSENNTGFSINKNHGTIPRVIQQMFNTIEKNKGKISYEVKVSFLEIHNEVIKDLLNKSKSPSVLSVREKRNGSIEVHGCVTESVSSAKDMWKCLEKGSMSRAVGGTAMNAESSRSHAIFTVYLSQRKIRQTKSNDNDTETKGNDAQPTKTIDSVKDVESTKITDSMNHNTTCTNSQSQQTPSEPVDDAADNNDDAIIKSKFHFVDLAGSERLKRTGAVGKRMKEGININCGLLALANVISALAEKQPHVPFRDSKITRLLQDSLGGNSQTIMLACISPADVNCDETINTLRYANRARKIKNKAVINVDPNVAKIRRMRSRIRELEMQLAIQGGKVPAPKSVASTTSVDKEEWKLVQESSEIYEKEMVRLEKELRISKQRTGDLAIRLINSQAKKEELQLKLRKITDMDVPLDPKEKNVLQNLRNNMQGMHQLEETVIKVKKELAYKQKVIRKYQKQFGNIENISPNSSPKASSSSPDSSPDSSNPKSLSKNAITAMKKLFGEDSSSVNEMKNLSKISEIKNREHSFRLKNLKRVEKNMHSEISEKQEMVDRLVKEQKKKMELQRQYENKLNETGNEIKELVKHRKMLLVQTEKSKKASEHQQQMLNKYNRRIKELEKKLKTYREKLKENDVLRTKLKHGGEKIRKLQEDITKAKRNKVTLSKKIKSQSEKYRKWMKQKDDKMKRFQKESRKINNIMNKMKTQNAKQANVLKRSLLQESLLRKKLKNLANQKPKVIIKRVAPGLSHSLNRKKMKNMVKSTSNSTSTMYRSLAKKKTNDDKENLAPKSKKKQENRKLIAKDKIKFGHDKIKVERGKIKFQQSKKKIGLKAINVNNGFSNHKRKLNEFNHTKKKNLENGQIKRQFKQLASNRRQNEKVYDEQISQINVKNNNNLESTSVKAIMTQNDLQNKKKMW